MTFSPVVPIGGVAGWRFLERTEDTQRAAFDRSPQIERDIQYFKENIGAVRTAEDLVSDRRLFVVALGAFGLDEEINKTFFLRKILEEGTEDPQALANRFVDPRYGDIARAFGFGNLAGARTDLPSFATEITSAYRTRQFEIAVGDSNPDLRLALGFRRQIADFAASDAPDGTTWFRIMGSQPMRTVFEAAYNLPSQFGTLDVDQQRDILRDKTRELFGDSAVNVFRDPDAVERVIDRFLVRRQLDQGPNFQNNVALTLLQSAASGGGFGAAARINLILSNA